MASSLTKDPARRVNSPAQILVNFGEQTLNGSNQTIQQQQQGRFYSNRLNSLNAAPARINNNNVSTKPSMLNLIFAI